MKLRQEVYTQSGYGWNEGTYALLPQDYDPKEGRFVFRLCGINESANVPVFEIALSYDEIETLLSRTHRSLLGALHPNPHLGAGINAEWAKEVIEKLKTADYPELNTPYPR